MAASTNVPFTLYTQGTPNGHKASIVLEEVGAEYKTVEIRFSENEQKSDWCVASLQSADVHSTACRVQAACSEYLDPTQRLVVCRFLKINPNGRIPALGTIKLQLY